MLQPGDTELGRVEILGVWPEGNGRACIALADRANDFQFAHLVAVGKSHGVFLPIALNPHFHLVGQRVDHRNTHPVQTAGELVVLVGELAAGMQPRKDQFDPGNALLRVNIHGHAAPVITDLQGIVLVQDHADGARVTGQSLVDAVVYDLLGQVVGTGRVGIHARTTAHRVQTAENFQRIGVISRLRHGGGRFPS